MTRLAVYATTAALAMALAGPACAQVAGTYAGTSADGSGISMLVGTDSSNGDLAITGASVGFSAPCKGGLYTLNTGWGFGLLADIVAHKTTNSSLGSYFDIIFSLTFSKDGQTATGKIETLSPTLYPADSKATKALFCESPNQTFTLTLQPPSATMPVQPKVSYLFDRKGRIVGTIQH